MTSGVIGRSVYGTHLFFPLDWESFLSWALRSWSSC